MNVAKAAVSIRSEARTGSAPVLLRKARGAVPESDTESGPIPTFTFDFSHLPSDPPGAPLRQPSSPGVGALAPPMRRAATTRGMLQAKLAVADVDAPEEQEADQAAEKILRMSDPVAAAGAPEDPLESRGATGARLSRKHSACEEEHDKGVSVQRRATPGTPVGAIEAPPIVEQVLSSGGRPLDAAARAYFEPRFGLDLSGVRVHTDARANASALAVNALAYTVARDIVFAQGQYAPREREGRRLLAHELAHVVQQGAVTRRAENSARAIRPLAGITATGVSGQAQPLAPTVRAPTQAALGHDFSKVRVYADHAVSAAAASLRAGASAPAVLLQKKAEKTERPRGNIKIIPDGRQIHVVRVDERGQITEPIANIIQGNGGKASWVGANEQDGGGSIELRVPTGWEVQPFDARKVNVVRVEGPPARDIAVPVVAETSEPGRLQGGVERSEDADLEEKAWEIETWLAKWRVDSDATNLYFDYLMTIRKEQADRKSRRSDQPSDQEQQWVAAAQGKGPQQLPPPKSALDRARDADAAERREQELLGTKLPLGKRIPRIKEILDSKYVYESEENEIIAILEHADGSEKKLLLDELDRSTSGGVSLEERLNKRITGENNFRLHTVLTKLRQSQRSTEEKLAGLERAVVVPWHDTNMNAPAHPLVKRLPDGRVSLRMISSETAELKRKENREFGEEVKKLPPALANGGEIILDPNDTVIVHDYDADAHVVLLARDLIAYQNRGVSKFKGDVVTTVSVAAPIGLGAGAAGAGAARVGWGAKAMQAAGVVMDVAQVVGFITEEYRVELRKSHPDMLAAHDRFQAALGIAGMMMLVRTSPHIVDSFRNSYRNWKGRRAFAALAKEGTLEAKAVRALVDESEALLKQVADEEAAAAKAAQEAPGKPGETVPSKSATNAPGKPPESEGAALARQHAEFTARQTAEGKNDIVASANGDKPGGGGPSPQAIEMQRAAEQGVKDLEADLAAAPPAGAPPGPPASAPAPRPSPYARRRAELMAREGATVGGTPGAAGAKPEPASAAGPRPPAPPDMIELEPPPSRSLIDAALAEAAAREAKFKKLAGMLEGSREAILKNESPEFQAAYERWAADAAPVAAAPAAVANPPAATAPPAAAARPPATPAAPVAAGPAAPVGPAVAGAGAIAPAEMTEGQVARVDRIVKRIETAEKAAAAKKFISDAEKKLAADVDRVALEAYLANAKDVEEAVQLLERMRPTRAGELNRLLRAKPLDTTKTWLPSQQDRAAMVARAEALGTKYGKRHSADVLKLKQVEWTNPRAHRGAFGQGLDDIWVAGGGDLDKDIIAVVDYKGQGARLSEGQMGPDWVRKNIETLYREGGPKAKDLARQLQRAWSEGRLQGHTITTKIKNGAIVTSSPSPVTYSGPPPVLKD